MVIATVCVFILRSKNREYRVYAPSNESSDYEPTDETDYLNGEYSISQMPESQQKERLKQEVLYEEYDEVNRSEMK